MSVIDKLASSLNRRDELPNQELADRIVAERDEAAVRELVGNLANKSRDIQSDCIKTLYEIGAKNPSMIAGYLSEFAALLDSKNNRLQWGAMTALSAIASERPNDVFRLLPHLAATATKGSVITRDNFVVILIKLMSLKKYADDVFPLLNEQLLACPANQLPMYAELAMAHVAAKHKAIFTQSLTSRLNDFEKESKRKRVQQVLKRMASS